MPIPHAEAWHRPDGAQNNFRIAFGYPRLARRGLQDITRFAGWFVASLWGCLGRDPLFISNAKLGQYRYFGLCRSDETVEISDSSGAVNRQGRSHSGAMAVRKY